MVAKQLPPGLPVVTPNEGRRRFLQRLGLATFGLGSCLLEGRSVAVERDSGTRKLKITGYKTILVNNVPPYVGMPQWLFVQLLTNEGISGLGERPTGWVTNLKSQVELIHDFCDRFAVGQSPFDIEKIWQDAYASSHDYRHPGLYGTPELAAIEMACWDLVGKATQQPVYNLLGGRFHEKLRGYSYLDDEGIWENPQLAGERAAEMLAKGMTVCKIDPFSPITGGPHDYSLETIRHALSIFRAIRDAVGDKMEVAIGTHGQFSTSGAIRVAGMLEDLNPYWFEEPVSPENVDEMAQVAAHTRIPIATGERLVTTYEFSAVLEKHAAGIIQPDVGQCGGILQAKEIAAMSAAHYAMIAPHMYCGPVAAAAAIQIDTCSPNFLIQEYNTTPLHEEILAEPLRFEKGFFTPSTSPGLGVELNEKVVRRQSVA